MEIWKLCVALMLGLVEGLTEFAPVSSTGHMIIVDDLLLKSKDLFSAEIANTFKIVIQLGSILAVVVVFRERFMTLLHLKKQTVITRNQFIDPKNLLPQRRLQLKHIIVGLLPALILGFLFSDFIDEHLFSVGTVIGALVVGAIWMIAADFLRPRKPTIESVDQITLPKAFMMGVMQCLALWPGFSRSGATISGGVLIGLSHRAAADFSFIMAVPIMLGASSLSMLKHWKDITPGSIPFFIVGFISAFLCALVVMHFFLKLIDKIKLLPFAIYRIVLSIALYFIVFS
ncbi:undecaprenyl-diphosphatase [Dictyobacter alpinus]|uniref:Undecaprenyl-diphosphatase n=1 Tax=Dictyobacter alpinus TaxID=2014873 RepID=A0A402BK30_9CHLR|nr:undecaprenyl-diphosphate phosphatase [Dictyobacter alpinus]GCE31717.1 undecaprenyl-diphosphatase [Dictyobacter alpinus]